jgi:O-antigen ligase
MDRPLGRAEFVLLCLFSIALPLVEAPKNIFWGLFFLLWLGRSAWKRDWGSLSLGWDGLFAALLIVPFIGVLASSPYPHKWHELGDIVGYLSLGWMLARSRLTTRQISILFVCLIVATLAGVAQGYWMMHIDPNRVWLQLNSVGHVNHSALYGMGIGSLAVVQACTEWFSSGAHSKPGRILAVLSALIMLSVMVSFGSRGALAAYILAIVVFLIVFAHTRKVRLWPVALVGLIVAAGTLALDPKQIEKTEMNIKANSITSERAEGAHTAVEVWRHRRLTGVGPANFSAVSPQQVEAWVTERGEPYSRDYYLFSSHAHNVFFNTLAERGLIGIAALLTLCFAWLAALLCRRPAADAGTKEWLSWGAGLTGWVIVFGGGMFNTTLHHEHGMLAMMCLGLLLALDTRRAEPRSTGLQSISPQ